MDASKVPPTVKKSNKKKCHGNRKLRRLRKQSRKRQMNDKEKPELPNDSNQTIHPIASNNNSVTITKHMEITTTDIHTTHKPKRKRMATSASLLSLSKQQPLQKKKKLNISTAMKTNHRLPAYLKSPSSLLFSTLRRQLNHRLSNKIEQRFIYNRLRLLDRQYRLQLHQTIWQSYLNIGSKQQLWPKQAYKMAKTDEHILCHQFVTNHLSQIQSQLEKCSTGLKAQSDACPLALLPLDRIDQHLIGFIQSQENHLSTKMDSHLNRYKAQIDESELWKKLSLDLVAIDQVKFVCTN